MKVCNTSGYSVIHETVPTRLPKEVYPVAAFSERVATLPIGPLIFRRERTNALNNSMFSWVYVKQQDYGNWKNYVKAF